ncbi:RNA polymerase sigma factor [Lacihabitans sp. CCS-44]|uniref:RNA polymerase sigma factor n=1 Tax=Lacihabitans sp. CCS-44 TaxID=2487331 RepID=UPI0020CE9CA6|nr:sigma-70 family RNA polymerase sigma factor [Lacihabitans sp. CCS-44]
MDSSNLIETSKSFWENAYKQNINKMIGVSYRYTADRQIAEDLAHDAFMIALEKVSSFEGKGAFEAWLRRIVVNVCMQYFREQNKRKYIKDWILNDSNTVETQEENQSNENPNFTVDELLAAINQLPEHHKLVFNMYVIDKFTHAQIGKELGISEGTSKSHLARARKKIKELLNEQLKTGKKKKSAFLLLFWNIDGFCRKKFRNFEIQNLRDFSLDSLNLLQTSMPRFKSPNLFFSNYLGFGVAGMAILSLLFWQKAPNPAEKTGRINYSKSLDASKFPKINTNNTATVSKNSIMDDENEFLNKKADSMKNFKALSAIVVASTSLALPIKGQELVKIETNTTPQIETKPVVSLSIQANTKANVNANVNINTNTKVNVNNNIDLEGTFYGEKLNWSAENNNLYFEGKSVVNFGKNSFISSGSSNFLEKVYYLVVDGKSVKLGSNIKLSDKKYNLNQLSSKTATEKYGEIGKKGAIEISLAE